MKRIQYEKLIDWKNDKERKPLILQGARQVGKTWLIKKFGRTEYKDFVYLNFELFPELNALFEDNLQPHYLIANLSLYLSIRIESEDTLICFDEIQLCPKALTSLKYFYEMAPEYHIISAGSLLGISIGKESSFPVGKVSFLDIRPMNFQEFLVAGGDIDLVEYIKENNEINDVLHSKLEHLLKQFLYIGGMPEVVQAYLIKKDVSLARERQIEILKSYENDFSKYSDKNTSIKISEVWKSLPYQLARENKKFKYSDVKRKGRSSMYDETIHWLENAGLIHIVTQIRNAKIPLSGYEDSSKFKIYMLDTGLLCAMLKIDSAIILKPNALFSQYYGAIIENYVCKELISESDVDLHYWQSDYQAEVDFVFQYKSKIIPLEVKSGTNKNIKGLRSFESKYKAESIYRTSPRKYEKRGNFINFPLYYIYTLRSKI